MSMLSIRSLAVRCRSLSVVAGALVLALLSGCGGGGGDLGEGTLGGSIALAQAEWVVVDLETGERSPYGAEPDLSGGSVRGKRMVFVRLPAGSGLAGSPPSTRWGQPDETLGSSRAGHVFVSVFEVTKGQWERLARNTPWTRLDPALAGADDERLPACGLSLDMVKAGCVAASNRLSGTFRVITTSEWEYACRAGSTARFSWGNATDRTTVARYAQVAETAGSTPGLERVGSRRANAFGLYDMEGSLWELTAQGLLRGGSWRDSLPMARAANHIAIDRTTPYALAGARLVYTLDDQ